MNTWGVDITSKTRRSTSICSRSRRRRIRPRRLTGEPIDDCNIRIWDPGHRRKGQSGLLEHDMKSLKHSLWESSQLKNMSYTLLQPVTQFQECAETFRKCQSYRRTGPRSKGGLRQASVDWSSQHSRSRNQSRGTRLDSSDAMSLREESQHQIYG